MSTANNLYSIIGIDRSVPASGFTIFILSFPSAQPGTFVEGSGHIAATEGPNVSVWYWSRRGGGTITSTTVTPTAAAGTFSFTTDIAVRNGVEITTQRTVANGRFSVTF